MKDQKEVVGKVIDYIEKNLEKKINLDNISKNIGYSKFYLNRVFTEQTGITIYKYLQNRRLTIAAEKLVKSNKPITPNGLLNAGYGTQQIFSFAFKQVYLYPTKTYGILNLFCQSRQQFP